MKLLEHIFDPLIFSILMGSLVVIILGLGVIFVSRKEIRIWIHDKLNSAELNLSKKGVKLELKSRDPLLDQVKAKNKELENRLSNTEESRSANAAGLVAGLHVANLWRLFYLREVLPATKKFIELLKEIRKESKISEEALIEKGISMFRNKDSSYLEHNNEQNLFSDIQQLLYEFEKQEIIERSNDDKITLTTLGDEFIEFVDKEKFPEQRQEYKDLVQ